MAGTTQLSLLLSRISRDVLTPSYISATQVHIASQLPASMSHSRLHSIGISLAVQQTLFQGQHVKLSHVSDFPCMVHAAILMES